MASGRKPLQIARRALILGAIAFRSSLEVTNHPRTVEISKGLLTWLNEMGCGDELDPTERELLATPFGHLNESQKVDAKWAGEEAAFFCWMLNLAAPLDAMNYVNQLDLPSVHCIMKPEAAEFIRTASLRDHTEIEDTCRHFVLVLSMLRESRIGPPGREIIRRMSVQKLNDAGVVITDETIRRASEAVNRMTPQERNQVAGLYFIRGHAALWFLSDRSSYFG